MLKNSDVSLVRIYRFYVKFQVYDKTAINRHLLRFLSECTDRLDILGMRKDHSLTPSIFHSLSVMKKTSMNNLRVFHHGTIKKNEHSLALTCWLCILYLYLCAFTLSLLLGHIYNSKSSFLFLIHKIIQTFRLHNHAETYRVNRFLTCIAIIWFNRKFTSIAK